MDTGTAGTGTDFHTGIGHFGKFGTAPIPVPDASVSSVQHQYRYRTLGQIRYGINIGTGHFGNFGTTIPVPDSSVSSVHQYRHLRYRCGRLYRSWYRYRYNIDTGTLLSGELGKTQVGTGHVGKTGTTSKPGTPHCDIKIRLILMRSDSELQIFTFRSEKKDRYSYAARYCKIRRGKILFENPMTQVVRFWSQI